MQTRALYNVTAEDYATISPITYLTNAANISFATTGTGEERVRDIVAECFKCLWAELREFLKERFECEDLIISEDDFNMIIESAYGRKEQNKWIEIR